MKKTYTICCLPGDGIGPEIMAEGKKVLAAVGARFGVDFVCKDALIGGAAIDACGDPLPAATLEEARASDAVLLAAPPQPANVPPSIATAIVIAANLRSFIVFFLPYVI